MTSQSSPPVPKVYVLDDDPALLTGLKRLLNSAGRDVETFSSPEAFLDALHPGDRGCLLLDIQFPGVNGLDFQTQLSASGCAMPVIIMTGHADVASSIRGLKSGATDFLIKPFDDEEMLAAIDSALAAEEALWIASSIVSDAQRKYDLLTQREKEVFTKVTAGMMNKQVAADLGLSQVTVKIHRGTMMRKMDVRTLADLVRIAEALKLDRGQAGVN
jgi:FixJ family two-component response regulator